MIFNSKIAASFLVTAGIGLVSLSSFTGNDHPVQTHGQDRWIAPAWADTLKSPYHDEPLTLANGEELFGLYCASCHGESGYGDGAAGGALGQKPANFHDSLVKKQSDGALFWKLSNGNGNMPPFQDVFTAEQRWQLVAYLRKLSATE
ncbi:cytochrome c [Dyadobacter sp. CY345]|uniref:c-type cytochrome n=1 Tax=Dyadobacter sp. CY345 TaxID=2909335 RepID=UPI001F466804|nr:cytochrome c [Dyadobacter sp. CY345]MCF2444926.1 cytochrome c [Dyadobacter sp. CY345]